MKDCLVGAKLRFYQINTKYESLTDGIGTFVGETLGQHHLAA